MQRTLTDLLHDFYHHLIAVGGLQPGSARAYAGSVKKVLQLAPGEQYAVPNTLQDFLAGVQTHCRTHHINGDQACSLRRFYQIQSLPLTMVGDMTTQNVASPSPLRTKELPRVTAAGDSCLVLPAVLTQPVFIEREYMRRQFIGRLESQERYYPNLFRQQPDKAPICLRYPATFFRYARAPRLIRQAVQETIQAATECVIFYVTELPLGSNPTVRAVPFSAVKRLEVVPAPAGAHIHAHCENTMGHVVACQLMQRVHGLDAAAEFEPFQVSPAAVATAYAKSEAGSTILAQKLFTQVSLDHVVPFTDTLRANVAKLPGLRALTALISQQGGPPLQAPNARYFAEKREIYLGFCEPGALPVDLVCQVAAEIRLLAREVQLEILSTSRNSQRGSNTFPSKIAA